MAYFSTSAPGQDFEERRQEPTRNAWVPLAAWFRRRGAAVIMVPPEQSADLRDYYSKHVKTDRLDSGLLARLPVLHPDGLRPAEGLGPAEPLRRAVVLRGSLVKRRSVIVARLDSYLELLGPAWHAAFGGDLALYTPLRFLAAGYADPHAVRRLGKTRLTRLIWRWSHGAWAEDHASYAEFSGGTVDFNLAGFYRGAVSFNHAEFSGGTVDFSYARFSGGRVTFNRAGFSGGTVDFSGALDWSCPPAFPWRGRPPSGVRLPGKQDQSQA